MQQGASAGNWLQEQGNMWLWEMLEMCMVSNAGKHELSISMSSLDFYAHA